MTVLASNGVVVETNKRVNIDELHALIKEIEQDELNCFVQCMARKEARSKKNRPIQLVGKLNKLVNRRK